MGWVEQIVRYLLIFFEYYSFFYVIFRKDFRRPLKQNIAGIVICCIVLFVSMALELPLEGNVIPLIIYILLYFIFEVSIVEMIGLALGQWLTLSMMGMMVYVGLEHWNLERNILEKIIMLIISMCLWFYHVVIGGKVGQELSQLPIRIWYLFDFVMLILTVMMAFFSYVIVEELPGGKVVVAGKGLVILGGSLIVTVLIVMIYYFNRTKSLQLQKELLEIQNKQQREYFLQLLKKEEETKCFRHDIINDLLALQNYCEQQNYDKLESYLESTLGVISNISKSRYDVGNDIINMVLSYYLYSIEDSYDVEVDGYINESIPIDQRDLCTVSANLVKNAVEAVKKLEYGKITFDIAQGTQYLVIKVGNTFEGDLNLGKDGMPETTKKDKKNHGIGLQNVKQVVQKYEGKYSIDVKDGRYLVEIFLKL